MDIEGMGGCSAERAWGEHCKPHPRHSYSYMLEKWEGLGYKIT